MSQVKIDGFDAVVIRFSITGEDGFEIYSESQNIPSLYKLIKQHAEKHEMRAIGFHALHALRIEKAYPVWGDLAGCDNLFTANMAKHIDFDKGDFLGKSIALQQKKAGITQQLFHAKMINFIPLDPDNQEGNYQYCH